MLANLFVTDLALIRHLSVDFHAGFSVLTGQTGAGKSLILDALNLFLEQKGAKELVREGAPKLEVSLFFDEISPDTARLLSDYFCEEDVAEGITLMRQVTSDGKSTCKIGGRTVPFSQLKSVAQHLLSIQGQNAAGALLDEKNHRGYLDSALSDADQQVLEEYRALYRDWVKEKNALQQMKETASSGKEKLALLDFQMKEIEKVKPKRGEEEALEARLSALKNSEKIHAALYTADRALSGGEKGRGAVFLLEAAAGKLETLGEPDPDFALAGELYEISRRVKEMAGEVSYRLSQVGEEDPATLVDKIQRRLDLLYKLKLKYGSTVEEVISYYESIKQQKDLTMTLKDDIKRATEQLSALEHKVKEVGAKLTRARKTLARALEEEIGSVLTFLDMPQTRFFVQLSPTEPGPEGLESVSFAISPNLGEGTKPLAQIASGGESSRIMLALHLKLGRAKDADTMVFDEVDTGISGATAQKIALALKKLSQRKQVLCVTHSAQVSTLSDHHYLVEKSQEDGRTQTRLFCLDEEGRLLENARLFAGATLTQEAKSAAEDLRRQGLREYEKWKDTIL